MFGGEKQENTHWNLWRPQKWASLFSFIVRLLIYVDLLIIVPGLGNNTDGGVDPQSSSSDVISSYTVSF